MVANHKRISPEMWKKFEALLFTHAARIILGETKISGEEFTQFCNEAFSCPEKWEEKYGIGHYKDRKTQLENHRSIIASAKPDAVYNALGRACSAHLRSREKSTKLDGTRTQIEEYELIQKHLKLWLKRARTYVHKYIGPFPVDEKIEALLSDDFFTRPPKVNIPLRRENAGRPRQPWLRQVDSELSAAGVTSIEHRKELLRAVGLLPYRN
jgi:hypothetical protein